MSQDDKIEISRLEKRRDDIHRTIIGLRGANTRLQSGRQTIQTTYSQYRNIVRENEKNNPLFSSLIEKLEQQEKLSDNEAEQLKTLIENCLFLILKEIERRIITLLRKIDEEESRREKHRSQHEEEKNESEKKKDEEHEEDDDNKDVFLDSAKYILSKENTEISPEELSEESEKLARVLFVYFKGTHDEESLEEMRKAVQETVKQKCGPIAEKEFASFFDHFSNEFTNESKVAMLQEFIRRDTQASLLNILEDRHSFERVFGKLTDSAFQSFIESPFFRYIHDYLKTDVYQNNRSGFFDTLMSTGLLSHAHQNDPALLFIITAGRIDTLKNNPDLYNKFFRSISSSQNVFIPKNSQEAFLALLITSADPQEKTFLEKLEGSMDQSGFNNSTSPYNSLFYSLQRVKSLDNQNQSFIKNFLFKSYTLVPVALGFLGSAINSINKDLSGNNRFIPATVEFAGEKIVGGIGRKILESAVKKIAPSLLGGPIGIAIALGLEAFKKLSSYFLKDIPFLRDLVQSLSMEKLVIYSFVSIFLMFIIFLSPSNPVQIQQKIIPEYLFESSLQYEERNNQIPLGCYEDASQIVVEAENILAGLQMGIWNFWNYHPDYPQYGRYSRIAYENELIEGQSATDWYETNIYKGGGGNPSGEDLFWCTWLVSIAYRRAGAPVPFTAGVRYAYDNWLGEKISANGVNPLEIPLGSAIFFNRTGRRLSHIGILCERTTQNGRDGTIRTCESNASQKNFQYNVVNGVLQESRLSNGEYVTISAYGLPPDVDPNSEACRNRNPTPTSIIERL